EQAMDDRFVISDVRVIDGTGAEPFHGSVAVEDGRIASVERSDSRDESAARRNPLRPSDSRPVDPSPTSGTIDGAGLTLCPGFIPIPTHADIALLSHPQHAPKLLQGVTTEVFSNCGLGFCPCTSEEAMRTQRDYLSGLFGDDTGVEWSWRTVAEYLGRLRRDG